MGLERLHDPGHQPLPDHGPGLRAGLHGKAGLLKPLIANILAALHHVRAAAEQFKATDPWAVLLR